MKRLLLLLLCLCLCAGMFTVNADGGGEKRILVIETSDIHGGIMDVSAGSPDKFQYRLARIAMLINEARASGLYDDVLLLDGGDLYQGTPVSMMTGGAVIRAALDTMKYDAVGLGNHEFDWEVTEYACDNEGTLAPYVLGDYFGDPGIPVLAYNLFDAETGERVPFTKDYAVIEKAGKRIAVIGYIPNYRNEIMSSKIAPYTIDGDLEKLDAFVRRVNETEKPDATVVLAHEEPSRVAGAMDPKQVALVCGGHVHGMVYGTEVSKVSFIQGGSSANGFAWAVLVISEDGAVRVEDLGCEKITADKEALYDTETNAAGLDPEIMAISRACWDAISEEMSEVLGYIDTPIVKVKGTDPNPAGNWVTWLMLEAVRDQGAVIAFYNNGGIRTSLQIPNGETTRDIRVSDIYTITPFGNKLLVYELNGQELARQLVNGLRSADYGDQMTGLTFTYTVSGDPSLDPYAREYTILGITLDDGTLVDINDTEKTYRVCTSDYNATVPGSVFEGKTPVVPEADAPTDNEAFIRLLRENSAVNGGYIPVDTGVRGVEVKEE